MKKPTTVKLCFKELLNEELIGYSEPVPVTNLPVYLINSEQIGISEQFCDDQKVPSLTVIALLFSCFLCLTFPKVQINYDILS